MRTTPYAAVMLLGLALSVAGCKKPKPSPQYEEANAIHARLYAAKLDDAYLDPEMERAEQLLQQVPSDSADAKAASELLARIRTERQRVQDEEEERRKAVEEALAPTEGPAGGREDLAPMPGDQEVAETVDAGSEQPSAGMSASDFRSRFSGCFQLSRQVQLEGQGPVDTWELKDIANCRDRHPDYVSSVVALKDGRVHGRILLSDIRKVVVMPDAGTTGSR